ncbi:UPF0183 family protein [Heterostelium album PN500]|uniref:UPF0183 family protein n=1 Tax=Heterostelium pallidum (strain ATCC 26659 / Pp 5 / PN500) TaxID=670386 RepID=D3BEP7_HETP5|nr:UPF0183 family protein [Heterostelium album PN500]EFA80378.1 UPF0183 family protein [Heterostelium album PN500]|eukprot:XP_020432498.1 UPF0183 family protein [Heterostelium album PN500]
MSRQLKLELQPGKSLGDFILGMTISEALNVIKPGNVAVINKVDIIFNDADPLSIDIVLKLVDDGVLLRFAPSSQRLRVIEIFDVSRLALSYRGSIFSSSDNIASFVNIYSKFGPSYPGDFNAKKSVYHLHYPGLSFSFPIPPKFNTLYSEGTELPVELPDGSTPLVSKIFIYSGLQMKTPLSVLPSQNEEIIICPNIGVYFSKKNCILTFNSTPQDVLSELGPPSKIYHKEEDNMKIHTYQVEMTPAPDYFYNYFHLGIDVLFDSKRNTAKKYIFHTNFPTHYEFNLYSKCSFKILDNSNNSKTIFEALKHLAEGKFIPNNTPPQQPKSSPSTTTNDNINAIEANNSNGKQQNNNNNSSNSNNNSQSPLSSSPSSLSILPSSSSMSSAVGASSEIQARHDAIIDQSIQTIHPDMKWEEVQNIFGKSGKPVVNNRGSISNPFGSTYFYGYPGIIFEIMRNQYISSVCLFDDSPIYVTDLMGSGVNNHNQNNSMISGMNSHIDSIENVY